MCLGCYVWCDMCVVWCEWAFCCAGLFAGLEFWFSDVYLTCVLFVMGAKCGVGVVCFDCF